MSWILCKIHSRWISWHFHVEIMQWNEDSRTASMWVLQVCYWAHFVCVVRWSSGENLQPLPKQVRTPGKYGQKIEGCWGAPSEVVALTPKRSTWPAKFMNQKSSEADSVGYVFKAVLDYKLAYFKTLLVPFWLFAPNESHTHPIYNS